MKKRNFFIIFREKLVLALTKEWVDSNERRARGRGRRVKGNNGFFLSMVRDNRRGLLKIHRVLLRGFGKVL